jgi:signal-transduction protein with cAMP-binding, CBS, and nucleotidyltransferase domain
MKTGIRIADAMTEKPIYVDSTTNLEECSKIMANNHVGSLLVKEKGVLTGVVTEQDIVRKAIAVGLDSKETPASNIMIEEMTTITTEKDIYDALVLMKKLNIRQLPVMEKERMVGLLTLKDILKIEPQLFDLLVEKFELREESRKPIQRNIPSEGICQACGEYAEKMFAVKDSLLCGVCKREQES